MTSKWGSQTPLRLDMLVVGHTWSCPGRPFVVICQRKVPLEQIQDKVCVNGACLLLLKLFVHSNPPTVQRRACLFPQVMSYTQSQSAYDQRKPYGPSRGYERIEFRRHVVSAATQGNSKNDKSRAQKRYSRKDYHRMVDGQSTDVIEVYTELEPKIPATKHPKHSMHRAHTHRARNSTRTQTMYGYQSTYEPAYSERGWPTQGPRSSLPSEDGDTYHGSEDACSLAPDIWEAESTTSQPCQQPMLTLDQPYKRLLLEARPTTGSTRSARTRRNAGSDSSRDPRHSRGMQPHRK